MPILNIPTPPPSSNSGIQSTRLVKPISGSIALARGKPIPTFQTINNNNGYAVKDNKCYIYYSVSPTSTLFIVYDMETKTCSSFEHPLFSSNSYKLIDIAFDEETNKDYFVLGYFYLVDTTNRKARLQTVWLSLDGTKRINRNYPDMGTVNGLTNSCVAIDRKNNLLYLVSSTSSSASSSVKAYVRSTSDITSNWEEVCDLPIIYSYSGGLDIRNMVYSEETNSLYYACKGSTSSSATRIIKVDITNKNWIKIGEVGSVSSNFDNKLIVYEDGNNVYASTSKGNTLFSCMYLENEVGVMTTFSFEFKIVGNYYLYQLDKYNCLSMVVKNPKYVYECFTAMIVGLNTLSYEGSDSLFCTVMKKGNYLLDYFIYINQNYDVMCVNQVTGEFKYFSPIVLHSELASNGSTNYYCSSDVLYEATDFTLVFGRNVGVLIA